MEVDDQGQPAAIVWDRTESVHQVVNRWRVDDDWWRVPISRTYFTAVTSTTLLEGYRDDRVGDWYLQRVLA